MPEDAVLDTASEEEGAGVWSPEIIKAGLSIGLKLTLEGRNQLDKGSFWSFVILVTVSIITQMNYLNKALDTFNTAVVTPIYYVFFTTSTIVSSAILFNGWGEHP